MHSLIICCFIVTILAKLRNQSDVFLYLYRNDTVWSLWHGFNCSVYLFWNKETPIKTLNLTLKKNIVNHLLKILLVWQRTTLTVIHPRAVIASKSDVSNKDVTLMQLFNYLGAPTPHPPIPPEPAHPCHLFIIALITFYRSCPL